MAFDFFNFRLADAVETVEHWKKASRIPNPFTAQKSDIEALQQQVGELRLQVAVLYRLLLSKGLLTETEIQDLLKELDLADGKADGQFDGDPISGISVADHPAEEPVYPEIRIN
jgi:hypothetical protein